MTIAAPLSAADDRPSPDTDRGGTTRDLFDKSTPEKLLRGLFEQALATLLDHVEVEGSLPSDAARPAGEFRLKLFPQGKSRSQEHVTAEGSFNLSPDADQQQFILRFKSSKPSQQSAPPAGDIL